MTHRSPILPSSLAGLLALLLTLPFASVPAGAEGVASAAGGERASFSRAGEPGDRPAPSRPAGDRPGERPGTDGPGTDRPGEEPGAPAPPPRPSTATATAPGLGGGGGGANKVARGHIVVRFEPSMPEWQRQQIALAAGGAGYEGARSGRFGRVRVRPGDSPQSLARRLRPHAGVLAAELDPTCQGQALLYRASSSQRAVAALTGALAGLSFTDPLSELQWTFERIRLGAGLDLSPERGGGVIVAVIDSGVAFGSGDRFPSLRGLDLEGTRFLPGLDLVDGGPAYDEGVRVGTSDNLFGHGTFAASQIAATVNNGVSGASVAHRATILPIRVLGRNNRGTFSDVAEGIDFAVARGARVINMSLGGPQGSSVLLDAIRRARAAGVVLVASAGNDAEESDFSGDVLFPARYPEVIGVGATAFSDARASYSSFGPGLDVMAPAGENTASFVAPGVRDAALAPSFLHNPSSGGTLYSSFWANGTSFAAPQVAGAAALLISLGIEDPEAIRLLLLERTRDLAAPGRDDATGRGMLDIFAAHRGLGFAF